MKANNNKMRIRENNKNKKPNHKIENKLYNEFHNKKILQVYLDSKIVNHSKVEKKTARAQ